MKKIKVKFDGYFDPKTQKLRREGQILKDILEKNYEVEWTGQPDYIFYNVEGTEYYKYDGIRIFETIEALCPDFNLCDYGIGFELLEFGDRYFRFPNYLAYPGLTAAMADKHKNVTDEMAKRKFCSFVYSNGAADGMREELFKCLTCCGKVDSGGKFLNNMPDGNLVENKLAFEMQHKFSIACENASHPGYHTEKLVEAFAAGTVPIYWGDPEVGRVFNPKAFINVMDYPSLDALSEKVREIDHDAEQYLEMLRQPALIDNPADGAAYEAAMHQELEKFIVHIIDQPLEQAYRRNRGFWGRQYLDRKKSESNIIDKYMKFRNGSIGRALRGIKGSLSGK